MDIVRAVTLDGTEHVVRNNVAIIALVQTTLVISTVGSVTGAVIQDTRETTAITNAALDGMELGVRIAATETVLRQAIPVIMSLENVVAAVILDTGETSV
ncbi:hypothetical protein ElyMa_000789300 [Elysia marginata]|uniref:Uncharacterized protein n=1 Tax=Elysia marginata TaxID=1093978 RepID=A0AAV4GVF1_9GAST|nr:hypothetical protein ElyMa_000789300 [Elysia marginata]